MSDWQPDHYDRFAADRQQPAIDLLAAIPDVKVARAVDLGCGSGLSTQLLASRWPEATITGIDSSQAMLDRAAERLPGCCFERADIGSYRFAEPPDLLFANASLHWLEEHEVLLPELLKSLAPGGWLAVQMPNNTAEPSHQLMESIASQAPFDGAPVAGRRVALATAEAYYDRLAPASRQLRVWETRYLHALESAAAIADWFATTALKPYLDHCGSSSAEAFRSAYEKELALAYPQRANGRVLLALPRLFILAQRDG